ncbi:MAG: glycosyltransferase [Chloroflexi bacterium]|nr:glycosyltransferase [Chloroflexota bacterium]
MSRQAAENRETMPHLLSILPTSPLPVFTGGRQRTYQVLRHLAPWCEITVAGFWRDKEDRAGWRQLAEELNIDVRTVRFEHMRPGAEAARVAWRRVRARFGSLPEAVAVWDQPKMHEMVDRVLAEKDIDIIQVEWPFLATYALPHAPIPRVLVNIDLLSVALARRAALASSRRMRARLQNEAQRWRRYEARVFPRFQAVVAMSEQDAKVIRERAKDARVAVLPNGVDTVELTPGEVSERVHRLLFVGSPTHEPNLDAACWLLSEIWPELRRRHPELELTLVNLDHPRVRSCSQPGATITGRLPDLTPVYHQADIALAPLRAGSGTRLKILEAFALGVPVVSTSIGCEGIDAKPARHLLVADDAPAFVAAVERLIADRELRRVLASEARSLVERRYDWRRIAELHVALYKRLIASKISVQCPMSDVGRTGLDERSDQHRP